MLSMLRPSVPEIALERPRSPLVPLSGVRRRELILRRRELSLTRRIGSASSEAPSAWSLR